MSQIITPVEHRTQSVPRSWMELLSNFAATWGRVDKAGFGLHCSKCGKDVIAENDISDRVLKVSCGCQEFASDAFTIL